MKKKKKSVSYAKWGYIFILPFFITYIIFSLIPLLDTIRYSFFEYYRTGIKEVGPNFIGMKNYVSLLKSDMITYGKNTLIMWVIGFIPQIVFALLLANWFTDVRLKIRGKQFFKVVIYLFICCRFIITVSYRTDIVINRNVNLFAYVRELLSKSYVFIPEKDKPVFFKSFDKLFVKRSSIRTQKFGISHEFKLYIVSLGGVFKPFIMR